MRSYLGFILNADINKASMITNARIYAITEPENSAEISSPPSAANLDDTRSGLSIIFIMLSFSHHAPTTVNTPCIRTETIISLYLFLYMKYSTSGTVNVYLK